jgi:hypothetical protein
MEFTMPDKPTIPAGADEKLLRRIYRDALEARQDFYKREHERFVRACELKMEANQLVANGQGMRVVREMRDQRAQREKLRERVLKLSVPPKNIPRPTSHNPIVFPPYNAGSGIAEGGSGTVEWDPWGPDAKNGKTGGRLANWQASRNASGSAYAATDVGIWYFAGSSGTLFVNLYTFVSAYAYIYAPHMFTYAQAYGTVVAQINGPSGILSNDRNDIYWKGIALGSDYADPSGYYFVQTAAPVQAGTWYLLLGGTVQDVWAGPDADAMMSAYTSVNFFGFYQY